MASPDVIAPALLLPIPAVSLVLSVFNWLFHASSPIKGAILAFLTILAAVAGGTALGVACGQPLRVVSNVFTVLLHTALSGISIYALSPSSQTPAFPLPFLGFFLSLAAFLVACDLVSALIPPTPRLLSAALALTSHGILLTLAIATVILLHRRHVVVASEMDVEKGQLNDPSPGSPPGRESSPTPATWPFPGSLAMQRKLENRSYPANPPDFLPDLFPPSTLTDDIDKDAYMVDCLNVISLPLMVAIAQVFASLSAGLDVAASMLTDGTIMHIRIRIASAAFGLLWSFMVLFIVQILPAKSRPHSSEKQAREQWPLDSHPDRFLRDHRVPRAPLSRRESDSLLDFLSLRDPFASLPPPPPPLPPIGLDLEEVDVGWNGSRQIGMQYRFPAPRSIVKGGRRKGKKDRASGKHLAHQDSARTLLPVPETRGTEIDAERDKGFGDEARLAQLLLQSLSEDGEDRQSPVTFAPPVPRVQAPQAAHVQPISRWSMSTTVQSVVSGSISNRSGMSTYTTCASEKVPTSRVSMNTIASVLGSRKSSETKRKSAMTVPSSKG